MGAAYSLYNFSRREVLHFVSKLAELTRTRAQCALVTWYLLDHPGEQIAFLDGCWDFDERNKYSERECDVAFFKDRTNTILSQASFEHIIRDLMRHPVGSQSAFFTYDWVGDSRARQARLETLVREGWSFANGRFQLFNFTKRERLGGCWKPRTRSEYLDDSAVHLLIVKYLFENRGDEITFVSDQDLANGATVFAVKVSPQMCQEFKDVTEEWIQAEASDGTFQNVVRRALAPESTHASDSREPASWFEFKLNERC